jgi:hypothetical protein
MIMNCGSGPFQNRLMTAYARAENDGNHRLLANANWIEEVAPENMASHIESAFIR